MRQLRELKLSTKIAAFLVFSLGASSILATVSPQPVKAEGPLLNTVRCLVRTVLLTECQPVSPPAPTKQEQAPAQNQTANQAPAVQPQQAPATTATPVYQSSPAVLAEPIELPQATVEPLGTLFVTPANKVNVGGISESQYATYFNMFSPYAVAAAQQTAEANVPLRQSPEGWKIFGVAWYWWGGVVLMAILLVLSVRQKNLRKMPALLKNQ